jgi:hypothetical protein
MPRRRLASPIAIAFVLAARTASAEGLCDPAGHFCMQIDTTSARVCDLLQRGGLDPDRCSVNDEERRESLRRAGGTPIAARVVRFDDFWVIVAVGRLDATDELSAADADAYAKLARVRAAPYIGADAVLGSPALARVHDVQTVRFEAQDVEGVAGRALVFDEVRAQDATYLVSFEGPAGPRLAAFSDSALATLDALPARSSAGPGEGLKWIARSVIAAVGLAGLAVWLGRKRRRGLDAHDLWPR